VKDLAPARELNRFGSPSRPRIAAAVIAATPGAEVRNANRVSLLEQQRGALVEVFDLLGQLQRQPGLDRDVLTSSTTSDPVAGPRLLGYAGMGRQFDRVVSNLLCHLDRESDSELSRGMHYPASWDPYFKAYMTLADVYRYPTQHFEHHRRQLTLGTAG